MPFSILRKFLVAFLILSLSPLLVLSYYSRNSMIQVGKNVIQDAKEALLENSATLLNARARSIARQVELLLEACTDDLVALSLIPFDARLYLEFSRGHQQEIWIRPRGSDPAEGIRRRIPTYREITFADPDGIERIRIYEGQITPTRRHVAGPFWDRFGNENYFDETRSLARGEIYVSRLMGRHVRMAEQLQGAADVENAIGGASYHGIIRFAAPVYSAGRFAGVVSLALDHRHLMEYTQHVLPIGNHEVVFPSYSSGNYAFLFDDQGWIITHPKFWDIRGYDRDTGRLVDPTSPMYNEENMKQGRIPFNLFHVPFIHKNYAAIAEAVVSGASGVTTTYNVGDVPRVMAYAPIRFNAGEYRTNGIFGGVTLGARTDTFQGTIDATAAMLGRTLENVARHFVFIILSTAVLVGVIAVLLAKSFGNPIRLLREKAEEVRRGNYDVAVDIRSGDELEALAGAFSEMGRELEKHRRDLVRSLKDLEASERSARKERDFIQSLFSNVVSGLMVVDHQGVISMANQNMERILGIPAAAMDGRPYQAALAGYPDLLANIASGFEARQTYNVDLDLKVQGPRKFIELNVSRLRNAYPPDDRSFLVIIRDITRRKKMERYLSRSDRLVSIGTLAAGIAHEIRNPLTGIALMLDDLHDRMSHTHEDQVLMQRALEEIEKLEKIITELLDFASQPSGKYVRAHLNEVIDNTLFLIKKQCKRQRVLLFRDTPSLPPVSMDPEKMKQALLNILLNALNVMPDGGELHVYTFLQDDLEMFTGGPGIEIRICDTGPGVDPADMDYIFDPFFTRTPKGTGLGLSITHTIIEEHKGKIVVDSKLGRGACFKIFFPVEAEKEEGGSHGKHTRR
jgi:PAS domain S-box-containing protein